MRVKIDFRATLGKFEKNNSSKISINCDAPLRTISFVSGCIPLKGDGGLGPPLKMDPLTNTILSKAGRIESCEADEGGPCLGSPGLLGSTYMDLFSHRRNRGL